MREEPDSLCATFINLELPSTDLDEGVFDAMDKFIENAKLAGALGFRGHEHVARLTEEVADFERGADATMSKNRAGGAKASEIAKANEWEEPLTDDSQRLEKRFTKGIYSGKKAARVEKSANGLWTLEYDERGELIRGYMSDEAA